MYHCMITDSQGNITAETEHIYTRSVTAIAQRINEFQTDEQLDSIEIGITGNYPSKMIDHIRKILTSLGYKIFNDMNRHINMHIKPLIFEEEKS